VLAYDAGGKRTVLGPELMGACRGLNLLLGMSQDPALGGPAGWVVAASLALFVTGVTWISRSEVGATRTAGIASGMLMQDLGILGLLGAALNARHFPRADLARPILPLEGFLVLLIVLLIVNLASGRALREPVPGRVQRAVKTGVLALVWLNVGVVAAVRGPGPALVVAACWLPAYGLGRWIYST
jgi:4-hydroxybenzoate polyprenyltransferase